MKFAQSQLPTMDRVTLLNLPVPSASAMDSASAGAERTMFADLCGNVMQELERNLNRELDLMADELLLIVNKEYSSKGCSRSGGGDVLSRHFDDQELNTLFEVLEHSLGEAKADTVATASIETPAASTAGSAASTAAKTTSRRRESNGSRRKRRKRRRRPSRRTPNGGRTLSGKNRRHKPLVMGVKPTNGIRRPSGARASLGAGAPAMRTTAAAATSIVRDPFGKRQRSSTGVANTCSLQGAVPQRRRIGDGGSHGVRTTIPARMGSTVTLHSETCSWRRTREMLLAAATGAALSIMVPRRWRPLVFLAHPLVYASVAWLGISAGLSNRYDTYHFGGGMLNASVSSRCYCGMPMGAAVPYGVTLKHSAINETFNLYAEYVS